MEARLRYAVMEYVVTPEERKRHGWGDHFERVFWLVHYTVILENGTPISQTAYQKVAYFNFDTEARLFQHYLADLERKAKP